jgi:hypothetical protein
MEIQIGKMILNGILYAILYIAAPLTALFLLDYFGIFTLSQYFIIGIIIFGIVGVFIAVLKSAYPKDSAKNRVIMFIVTIYSGVYLFYIFGGFDPTVELGNFSISTEQLEITLGLKLIAWLSLGAAAVRSLQYLFEAFELRGVSKDSAEYKRRARPSLLFKVIGTLVSLGLAIYILTLIGSGVMIRPSLNTSASGFSYSAPDSLNFTLNYDLSNGGIYPLRNVNLKSEIWVDSSENDTALPPNTKIGESGITQYSEIGAFSGVTNKNITVIIDTGYVDDLATTNATLSYHIIFDTFFGGITINLTLKIPVPWDPSSIP